jgi:indole-3-glycerol phosphate synthase
VSLLERILNSKRAEIDAMTRDGASAHGAARSTQDEPVTVRRGPLDVAGMLRRAPGAPLRVITEIKKKSPSAGALSTKLDAAGRAEAYAAAGASMISVLCDTPFFGGSWGDVLAVRARLDRLPRDVPVLAKEFVLHELQIDRARAAGADAVLLIARIVSPSRLAELHDAACARDLQPLVEVVDEAELGAALACGARVIGVNARDLDTLAMDADRTARVLAAIPADRVAVHLSGIKTEGDVRAVAAGRADAALIGETLMREDDPGPKLRALVEAAR